MVQLIESKEAKEPRTMKTPFLPENRHCVVDVLMNPMPETVMVFSKSENHDDRLTVEMEIG